MLEIHSNKKHKIYLPDYDFRSDIQRRIFLSELSMFEFGVLEEILFSPLRISFEQFLNAADCSKEQLMPILQKLQRVNLLILQDDKIVVDKEVRRYFEVDLIRFSPDCKPGMELIQNLLKKIPIHHLLNWYAIPRASDNIFESIVEKYLLTPQIFQKHLQEIQTLDPLMDKIIQDLFTSPDWKICSTDLIQKYNLSREKFEELSLLLEFQFVACLVYEKSEDHWVEWLTPFYEWRQYLQHLKNIKPISLDFREQVQPIKQEDFAFIQDMNDVLKLAQEAPLCLTQIKSLYVNSLFAPDPYEYCTCILQKIYLMGFGESKENYLHVLPSAQEWLPMKPQDQASYLYRHPLNRPMNPQFSDCLLTDKNMREIEKMIQQVPDGTWIVLEEFFKGIIISFKDPFPVLLKQVGKHWKYVFSTQNELELEFTKKVVLHWLFELGITKIGLWQGKDCFTVTSFGRSFFEDT